MLRRLSLTANRLLIFVYLLLLSGGSLCEAQTAKMPAKQCGDSDTQSEMNDCAARKAHEADDVLNSVYRELLGKIKNNNIATSKVIAAEKAWMAFRDAELAAKWPVPDGERANALYGSVHPFCYYSELEAMTWERVKRLKDLMRDEEGDVCASGLAQSGQSDGTRTCSSNAGKPRVHDKGKG